MERHAYSYDKVAFAYDALASVYSFGRIARSKRAHLSHLRTGDRVLYVGVGRGDEAVAAAAQGIRVTALDLSPRMLAALGRASAAASVEIESICGDVTLHRPTEPYDAVCVHYFLNLFSESDAAEMIDQLAGWVRPGGLLSLADFAPVESRGFARVLTSAYYRPANWVAWALGFCELHPIPDYPAMLSARGFEAPTITRFPIGPGNLPAYWSVIGRRGGRPEIRDLGAVKA